MPSYTDDAVYINGRFLNQNRTGVQRYSRRVVLALDGLLERNDCPPYMRELEWTLLAPPGTQCDLDLRHIRFREVGMGGGHPWEQLHLSRHSRSGRLLSPAGSGPIFHPKQIVVLHDAAIYNAPSGYATGYRLFHKSLEAMLVRTACIATVSHFSRRELASCLGIPAEEILLAPNGTDHFRSIVPDPTIVSRLGLEPGRYFVTLGLSTANKNIPLAIEAHNLLDCAPIKLVVVGKGSPRVFGPHFLKPNPGVIFTGQLPDEQVAGLLRSSAALLFPSRYEGFGIPSLEAMLHGCPVIASTAPALMEVCGNAALHFHPDDAGALKGLMRRILDQPEIADAMRAKGYERLGEYQWDSTAAVLMEALKDLDYVATPKATATEHSYKKGVATRWSDG